MTGFSSYGFCERGTELRLLYFLDLASGLIAFQEELYSMYLLFLSEAKNTYKTRHDLHISDFECKNRCLHGCNGNYLAAIIKERERM
jgi:hypothetical protein